MAREMCQSIGRYDKLRFVVIQPPNAGGLVIGLFEFSFDLVAADINRFRTYGIELYPATDCRFGACISDSYQGQGGGSALFPFVAGVARQFCQRRIILWGGVHAGNQRAIRYYNKNGFRRVGAFTNSQGIKCYDMLYDLLQRSPPHKGAANGIDFA